MKRLTSTPPLLALTLLLSASACSPRPAPPPGGPSAQRDDVVSPQHAPEDAPAPTEEAFEQGWEALRGRHSLRLASDASWHRHSLEVLSVAPGAIDGVVSIDQGIGPQGRAPTPDEKLHTVRFRATRDAEAPGRLRFSLIVGELDPAVYTFNLHLCPLSGATRCDDAASDAAPHLRGVVIVGERAGEQTLRAFTAKL